MKRPFQVTFSQKGYVVSRSIQIAENAAEAIQFARLYHPTKNAAARAVLLDELEPADEPDITIEPG